MSFFGYDNSRKCLGLAVILSAAVGVITALLTVTAVVAVTPAFLWVVLGVAVVYLAVLLVSVSLSQRTVTCQGFHSAVAALLIGILGAALLSVLLLAVAFPATSILGAVIVGALLFFAALILTSTACLIKCIVS